MDKKLDTEDSLEHMDSALKEIKKVALESQTEEICGFVVENGGEIKAIHAKNDAEDKKNFFQINPIQFLSIKKQNEKILYIFHSHVYGSAEPSEFDIEMSKHCDIDFLIYSVEQDEFKTLKKK